jgi:tRNA(fMet)-specific endonuclease VapC
MEYLVDTDLVIDYLKNVPAATQILNPLLFQGIAVSILTYAEVWEGILGGANRKQHEVGFYLFLRSVTMLGVSRPVARRLAAVRADLRARKRPVQHRAFDLVLAATALEHGLTLATRNTKDYADIPALALYY